MNKATRYFLTGLLALAVCFCGWLVAFAIHDHKFSKQFYVVTLDTNTNYVCTLHGTSHFWYPFSDAYIARDIYLVRPSGDAKSQNSQFVLVKHDRDVYWPWQTLIATRHIVMVEPVGKESPLGKMIEEAEKH